MAIFSRIGDATVAAGESFNVTVQLSDLTGVADDIEGALTLCVYQGGSVALPVIQAGMTVAGDTATAGIGSDDTSTCYAAQELGFPLSWGIWYNDGLGAQWLALGRFTVRAAPAVVAGPGSAGIPHAPTLALTFSLPNQALALTFAGPRGPSAWEGMASTINPATGEPYIAEPTVEAMIEYLMGLVAPVPTTALLLEDGSPLLAEDGSNLLMEA